MDAGDERACDQPIAHGRIEIVGAGAHGFQMQGGALDIGDDKGGGARLGCLGDLDLVAGTECRGTAIGSRIGPGITRPRK